MSTTSMEDVFKAGFACGVEEGIGGDSDSAYEKYRYDQLLRAGGKQVADEWLAARKKPVDASLQNLKCPDCNGPMLARKSQYGSFWGCKDYPRCKGTRDSEGLSKLERAAEQNKEQGEIYNSSPMGGSQGGDGIDVPVESGELYKFKKG